MKLHPQHLGLFILTTAAIATGCSPTLDTWAIAETIHQELSQQGDLAVTAVTCPRGIEPATGESFRCFGQLDDENGFVIHVEQQDDQGGVEWTIPNSRGVINLAMLEQHVQDEIAQEFGRSPAIDCGGTYRVNQPGDQFDCNVVDPLVIDERRLDAIQINLDSQGNINWQQVRNLVDPEELAALKDEMPDAVIEPQPANDEPSDEPDAAHSAPADEGIARL